MVHASRWQFELHCCVVVCVLFFTCIASSLGNRCHATGQFIVMCLVSTLRHYPIITMSPPLSAHYLIFPCTYSWRNKSAAICSPVEINYYWIMILVCVSQCLCVWNSRHQFTHISFYKINIYNNNNKTFWSLTSFDGYPCISLLRCGQLKVPFLPFSISEPVWPSCNW